MEKRWFKGSLYENFSRSELPCPCHRWHVHPPTHVYGEYTKKEKFMTTTTRERIRERAGEGQGGEEQEESFGGIHPLLLAALMARRRERGGIHPLLLAALASRREEGEGIQHPLILAALMARRKEQEGEGISPIVLATLLS